jgi:hypothetical protein
MATSGELTKLLAANFNLPEITVSNCYRALREAGCVPVAGRGPKSSAPVTAETCAKLLIGLCGARYEKEPADRILENYGGVVSYDGAWFTPDGDNSNPDGRGGRFQLQPGKFQQLCDLDEGHTFLQGLTAVIETAQRGEFDFTLRGASPVSHTTYIGIEFWGAPTTGATIEVMISTRGGLDRYSSDVSYGRIDHVRKPHQEKMDLLNSIDFELRRRFRQRTIIALADLLNGIGNEAHEK